MSAARPQAVVPPAAPAEVPNNVCPICSGKFGSAVFESHVDLCIKQSFIKESKKAPLQFTTAQLRGQAEDVEQKLFKYLDNLESSPPNIRGDLDVAKAARHMAASLRNAYIRLNNIFSRLGIDIGAADQGAFVSLMLTMRTRQEEKKKVYEDDDEIPPPPPPPPPPPSGGDNKRKSGVGAGGGEGEAPHAALSPSAAAAASGAGVGAVAGAGAQVKPISLEEQRLFEEFLRREGTCSACKQPKGPEQVLAVDKCGHRFCTSCLQSYFKKIVYKSEKTKLTAKDFHCPGSAKCTQRVPDWMAKRVLDAATHDKLMQASLQIFLDDSNLLVSCPNPACRFTFEPVAGAVDKSDAKGPDGKPLSKEANEHRVRCRFRCAKCATVFCSQCHAIPYHVGFTCEQYKAFKEAQHCRFCNDSLSDANTAKPPPAGAEEALKCVCTKPECLAKRAKSCGKVHQCGHPCGGLSGEAECLPCLHSECRPDEEKTAIDDFCNICWVESIGQAPALKLKCGHIFHESCLVERLQKKWSGARINFGFLKCPLCKKQIAHPSLEATLKPYLKLLQDVEAKALQRLKFEGLDKDPNITDPNAKYYGQPAAYALDRFAYYPCFKCNRPYFGGRRACEEAARDEDEKFDPKELVCGSCAANSEAQNCKVHGREFIEYKCKWCCEVASFFCWGTTHFCVSCHKRQEQGDYLTKKKRSELPVCQGPGKCKLGGKHPPNGEEFALGCAICRRMTT